MLRQRGGVAIALHHVNHVVAVLERDVVVRAQVIQQVTQRSIELTHRPQLLLGVFRQAQGAHAVALRVQHREQLAQGGLHAAVERDVHALLSDFFRHRVVLLHHHARIRLHEGHCWQVGPFIGHLLGDVVRANRLVVLVGKRGTAAQGGRNHQCKRQFLHGESF